MDDKDDDTERQDSRQDHPLVIIAMFLFMGASLFGLKWLAAHFGIPVFNYNPVPIMPLPM